VLKVWTKDGSSGRPDSYHLKKAGEATVLSDQAQKWLARAYVAQTTPGLDVEEDEEKLNERLFQMQIKAEVIKLSEVGYTHLVRAHPASNTF
jgi:hypothetical protein